MKTKNTITVLFKDGCEAGKTDEYPREFFHPKLMRRMETKPDDGERHQSYYTASDPDVEPVEYSIYPHFLTCDHGQFMIPHWCPDCGKPAK